MPPTPHPTACRRPPSAHVLIVRWRLPLHADVAGGEEAAVEGGAEDEVERIMREATDYGVDESRRPPRELSPLRPSEDSGGDSAADAADADATDAGSVVDAAATAAALADASALSCGDMLKVYVSTREVWSGAIISIELDSHAHAVNARMDWFDGTERSDVILAGTKPRALQHSLAVF